MSTNSRIALPDHLHIALVLAQRLVVMVDPAEEEPVVAHLRQQRRLFPRVTKWINLPRHSRPSALAESLIQNPIIFFARYIKLRVGILLGLGWFRLSRLMGYGSPETESHLIDDVDVVRRRFVVHAPSSSDELESTLRHLYTN